MGQHTLLTWQSGKVWGWEELKPLCKAAQRSAKHSSHQSKEAESEIARSQGSRWEKKQRHKKLFLEDQFKSHDMRIPDLGTNVRVHPGSAQPQGPGKRKCIILYFQNILTENEEIKT